MNFKRKSHDGAFRMIKPCDTAITALVVQQKSVTQRQDKKPKLMWKDEFCDFGV